MPLTINQLKSQLNALQLRLDDQPEKIDGVYNRKHFALKAKITNNKKLLEKAKWNEFLAK